MKKITLNMVLAALCLNFTVKAQNSQPLTALEVGDKISDLTIGHILNYKDANGKLATTAKISDFKGKLLILDFWATWCSSCLAGFSKLQTLQQHNSENLQILLVNAANTRDTKEKINKAYYIYKTSNKAPLSLPTLYADTLLVKLFPHYLLPHYVWIGTDARVKAITSAEEITQDNINSLLKSASDHINQKNDLDDRLPLFTNTFLPIDNMSSYKIFLKGFYNGLSSGCHFRRSGKIVRGLAITNTDLLSMYKIAFYYILPSASDKQIIIECERPNDLTFASSGLNTAQWNSNHVFTLDLIDPVEQKDSLYYHLLDVLNSNSNYNGHVKKRLQSCYTLMSEGNFKKLKSKGGTPENTLGANSNPHLSNQPLNQLIQYLNELNNNNDLIIDETGFTGNIDFAVTTDPNDLVAFQKDLDYYQLKLVKTKREIPVLVISSKSVILRP